MNNKICLTFDTEEWNYPLDYNLKSKYTNNTSFSMEGTKLLLKLLNKHNAKATFFITGYFAEKEPSIVNQISQHGHEIACHGYYDEDLKKLPVKLRFDRIKQATDVLAKYNPIGFRAPMCSIDIKTLKFLKHLGYKYDSSVHPAIVPGYYYNFNYPLDIYCPLPDFVEIPMTVIPGIRFPISWWWARNMGFWITKLGTNLNIDQRNINLYFHPWEFVNIPKIKGLPNHTTRNCGIRFLKNLDTFMTTYNNHDFLSLEKIL